MDPRKKRIGKFSQRIKDEMAKKELEENADVVGFGFATKIGEPKKPKKQKKI